MTAIGVRVRLSKKAEMYAEELMKIRQHRGLTLEDARTRVKDFQWLAPLMVRMEDADCMVAGLTKHVRKTMGPMLALAIGVVLLAGLTVLPATLVLFGKWTFWPLSLESNIRRAQKRTWN